MVDTPTSNRAQTIDDVPAEWRAERLPRVFAAWHHQLAGLQAASAAAMIAAAEIVPGDTVIDLACGSGIPALDIAALVGDEGRIFAIDPSPVFVRAATENATRAGLKNVTVLQASAGSFSLPANIADAATCHLGIMFFADVPGALARVKAVLKPGGRFACVAWGNGAANAFFGAFWDAVGPFMPPPAVPEPPMPATGPLRFAGPGSLTAVLSEAGFEDVREDARTLPLVWSDGVASLLALWLGISNLAEQLAPETVRDAEAAVRRSFARFATGDELRFTAEFVIASARR